MNDNERFMTGQVWQRKHPDCRKFAIVFCGGNMVNGQFASEWALLCVNQHGDDPKLTALNFQHFDDGEFIISEQKVLDYLVNEGTKLLEKVIITDIEDVWFG